MLESPREQEAQPNSTDKTRRANLVGRPPSMSFDVFLLKFDKNDLVCALPEDAFHEVIHRHDVKRRHEHFYDIQLQDGSFVEAQRGYAPAPNSNRLTSVNFMMRGGSDSIAQLIFECAQATGGVLIPTMEGNPCIMVDVSQRDHLPPDFGLPLVECHSAEELTRLLRGGYQAWSRYRDQIVQGDDSPNPPA